jgi:peptidoglycan/xylan/chitin deacetylase (PgdA/CDA1 family)
MNNDVPLVSFSFDDAPASAFERGAEVLEASGVRATFYVSLGLVGSSSELGPIGTRAHLQRAFQEGHELGCHTFDHLDAWHCTTSAYVASIERNRSALHEFLPSARFRSFAYPKSGARTMVKKAIGDRFECGRGGGQTFNCGVVDLNLVRCVFLDRYTNVDLPAVRDLIARNAARRGWLVFAAHDISHGSGPLSCDPAFLSSTLRMSIESGAKVVPVAAACELLRTRSGSAFDNEPR